MQCRRMKTIWMIFQRETWSLTDTFYCSRQQINSLLSTFVSLQLVSLLRPSQPVSWAQWQQFDGAGVFRRSRGFSRALWVWRRSPAVWCWRSSAAPAAAGPVGINTQCASRPSSWCGSSLGTRRGFGGGSPVCPARLAGTAGTERGPASAAYCAATSDRVSRDKSPIREQLCTHDAPTPACLQLRSLTRPLWTHHEAQLHLFLLIQGLKEDLCLQEEHKENRTTKQRSGRFIASRSLILFSHRRKLTPWRHNRRRLLTCSSIFISCKNSFASVKVQNNPSLAHVLSVCLLACLPPLLRSTAAQFPLSQTEYNKCSPSTCLFLFRMHSLEFWWRNTCLCLSVSINVVWSLTHVCFIFPHKHERAREPRLCTQVST